MEQKFSNNSLDLETLWEFLLFIRHSVGKDRTTRGRTIITLFIIVAMVIMVSCRTASKGHSTNKNTYVKLSRSDWRIWTYDDIVVVDLTGNIAEADTFDAHEIIGKNHALCDILRIKFLTNFDIVSAEKITCYYPTIWAGANDDVMQFIYLFNLCYKDTCPLNVHNGVIEYPLKGRESNPVYLQYFGGITRNQMLTSIGSVPAEYAHKNTSLIYETNSWKSDAEVWKRIAGSYTPGELTDEDNEPFDVDPYEILLVVTFKKDDRTYTKYFCDEAVIGN